jgi:hypothetical protein
VVQSFDPLKQCLYFMAGDPPICYAILFRGVKEVILEILDTKFRAVFLIAMSYVVQIPIRTHLNFQKIISSD